MSADRVYRLLLRAYPPEFRAKYGPEMLLLFRDQCRESDVRTIGFWAAVISDVARSAPALRAEAWRLRGRENTGTAEVFMRIAAVLTVLCGAYGVLGGVVEWVAGQQQTMGADYVLAIVLGLLASALLLAAGVAIVGRTPRSRQVARLALLASLVVMVAARVVFGWMSIFLQLVGFGLPVALLIALSWPRRASPLETA